jgi:hypothetical protein
LSFLNCRFISVDSLRASCIPFNRITNSPFTSEGEEVPEGERRGAEDEARATASPSSASTAAEMLGDLDMRREVKGEKEREERGEECLFV